MRRQQQRHHERGQHADQLGKGEGEVNLVAWAGYVEDGSTDPKVDWVSDFEKQTGCKVNVKVGNTSDEMVQLMRTGQYDGVSASGDATLRLIDGGDVAPVNTDLVPNYADVFPGLKDQPYNSVDGQMYGIPHGRGANLMMSNTDDYKTTPDSVERRLRSEAGGQAEGPRDGLRQPDLHRRRGAVPDEDQPDLGITNPYELTRISSTRRSICSRSRTSTSVSTGPTTRRRSRRSPTATRPSGTTWQVIRPAAAGRRRAGQRRLPEDEGSTGWSDTWMVSSQAKHPNCMYMWMNHIIDPKIKAQVAEWFGEAPAN